MWDLKKKANEQTNKTETPEHREQAGGYHAGDGGGGVKQVDRKNH